MKKIKDSELVTNSKGNVYHLDLAPEEIADTILLVGDPGRVSLIGDMLDKIELKRENREIKTITGEFQGKRISTISTGMGVDNIDIVLTELDILANINLKTREVKKTHKSLNLIRIGTCGVIQPEVEVESYVLSHYVVGIDGMMYYYDIPHNILHTELSDAVTEYTNWDNELPKIYACAASPELDKLFVDDKAYRGITLTSPGFYGPQGRQIRLPLKHPELNTLFKDFSYNNYKITNYEMESSSLYCLGQSLGHKTLTICLAIANRATGKFSSNYKNKMCNLIEYVINTI